MKISHSVLIFTSVQGDPAILIIKYKLEQDTKLHLSVTKDKYHPQSGILYLALLLLFCYFHYFLINQYQLL